MISTLFFDVGNTLIVDSGLPGSMVDWDVLETVEGAVIAVQQLSKQYRCLAVSNATDSSAVQMLEALKKAGFGSAFQAAFTQKEVGNSKNEPGYYKKILERLHTPADEILMVGDHPAQDVIAPSTFGIGSLFFNPTRLNLWKKVQPVQIGEFNNFTALPALLNAPTQPALKECYALLAQYNVADNIVQHQEMVALVAYDLSMRLIQQRLNIDPILAHRAALVHDIDRCHPQNTRETHGILGAKLLRSHGYDRIADIVAVHVAGDTMEDSIQLGSWEEKVVCYADKLVNHQHIVSVDERFSELKKRYPAHIDSLVRAIPKVKKLESEILSAIHLSPETYLDMILRDLSTD